MLDESHDTPSPASVEFNSIAENQIVNDIPPQAQELISLISQHAAHSQRSTAAHSEFTNLVKHQLKIETTKFISDPSEDQQAQEAMGEVDAAGGPENVWKPDIYGIVLEVTNYIPNQSTIEAYQKLNRKIPPHTQKILYYGTNGLTYTILWGETKSSCAEVPKGFNKYDGIHVQTEPHMQQITKLEKVALDSVKDHI